MQLLFKGPETFSHDDAFRAGGAIFGGEGFFWLRKEIGYGVSLSSARVEVFDGI
jgi:hypothetical protein